jgi:2-dehydro-3-deoxygluconokinase
MDVITLGEALVIFSPESTGPLRFVNNFTKSIGGAEANLSIALARLGHKVGWISRLGDDEFGRYIAYSLRGENIDLSQVSYDANYPTGILFKELYHMTNPSVYYYRKNSAASYLTPELIDLNYIAQAKILHITGILPALSASCLATTFQALDYAKQSGVKISFDPNIRYKLWQNLPQARSILMQVAQATQIIFPSIEEAEFLLNGTYSPEKICDNFHQLGCQTVVLKLGIDGCLISHQGNMIRIAGFKSPRVIDSVGAGDGFAAGFLAGVLQNKSLAECGAFANGVGALATTVSSDSQGYPTLIQLLEFIGKVAAVER